LPDDNFVPRPAAFEAIKGKLLGVEDRALVVSAIAGLGGIGKSVLATAVVLDEEVRQWFDDGILWVTLGQNPDLLSLLGDWIRELDKSREAFSANTLEAAKQYLGTLLAERQMLLVVDDVWNAAHAEWFRVGGVGCRVLVTTREARLEGAEEPYILNVMSPQESLELVKGKLGKKWTEEMTQAALEFAKLLGYLPLALRLMAVQVARGRGWENLKKAFLLETDRLRTLDYPGVRLKECSEIERRKYSLRACLQLSLERLKEDRQEYFDRFLWLGVLPEDVEIRELMVMTLWNVEDFEAEETLIELYERSLLTSGVAIEGERSYRIHDLMHDLARDSISSPTSQDANQLGGLGLTLIAAHRQFLERYRAKTPDRRWDKLPSDGYIHRHLTWHMVQADWQDEIHALMAMSDERGNNAWFEACDRIGKPAIFVEDVGRAWELAEQMYGSEPTRSIVLQCRYALITATWNSLVTNLPIGMMAEFVKGDFWTVEQAWAYVEQMQDEKKVMKAIELLAPYLTKSKPLVSIAVNKARGIQNQFNRVEALISLVRIDRAYLSETLTAAQALHNGDNRAKVLISLATLNDANFFALLTAAQALHNDDNRAKVLISLATLNDANFFALLTAAREIQFEPDRAKVLSSLVTLDGADLSELLTDARGMQGDGCQAEVLSSLARIDRKYLSDALTAARGMRDKGRQAKVLSSLARIDRKYLSDALTAAREIPNKSSRAEVLSNLGEIDSDIFREALTAAREILDESSRAKMLSSLARIDRKYLSDALTAAREIPNKSSRAKVLSSLGEIDSDIFREALTAAREIPDEFSRAEMLSSLVRIDSDIFREALAAAREIPDESSRAELLSSLVTLDSAEFSQLLAAVREIRDEDERAMVLGNLIIPDDADFFQLLAAVRGIKFEDYQVEILSGLAKIDEAYFLDALAIAKKIYNDYLRAIVLSNLAKIEGADFHTLLATTQEIEEDKSAISLVLSSLVILDGADFHTLLEAAEVIDDEQDLARVLSSLAGIKDADFHTLLEAAKEIGNEHFRARVLSSLAQHAPQSYLGKIWETNDQITHKPTRANAISDYIPLLSHQKLPHPDWCKYLHLLASRKRSGLMADLAKLYPAILHLGGETAMRGVVDAMDEVCGQWK
jgi:hypothetical protein